MKKLMATALVLCLTALAMPVLAETEPVVTGEWFLVEMTADGVTLNPAEMNMSMEMVLNGDGTAAITTSFGSDGDAQVGTWTMEGDTVSVTIQDDTEEFVYADERLTADQEGMTMVLGREEPAAAALPEDVAAESEEDFLGTWTMDSIIMNGVLIPAENFGIVGRFDIEPGKVTETSGEGDEAKVTEYTSEFVEGALQLTAEDSETALPLIHLNSVGGLTISVQAEEEGLSMTMYFVKAE